MGSPPPDAALWVGVLGPVALRVDGADVRVAGMRRRALLATLALAGGRVVGVDRLVDALWPDDPPHDAAQALYNHVSRLRGSLGAAQARLTRQGLGYVLRLAGDELDASVARAAAAALAELSPAEALGTTSDALALWRGPALEEFRGRADLEVEAIALQELRRRLHEAHVVARIETRDASAVSEASSAVLSDPLHERSVLLLMLALAREGRTAEAMNAAVGYRRRLVEETGLDATPALAQLEQEIAAGGHSAPARTTGGSARRTVAALSGPLVGREREHDEVVRLLAGHRAVTLSGPGGVGKTRLALEVIASVGESDRVDAVMVDLAAVQEPGRVTQAVSSSIGLRLVAASPSPNDVASALADATLLLLLDNAEHVVGACRDLVDALDRLAPGVRVLTTSRATLHAPSEYVVRLNPLPTPIDAHDLAALGRQPSVRAFLEHARRRDPEYALTASDAAPLVEILQHLDGLPLAIELMAGHVPILPLTTIRNRLGRSLDLAPLHRTEDDRQRTLRVTIRWSYDLLTPAQQTLLRAVAAFPGGVDLTTVEDLADELDLDDDPVRLLHALVDASLVHVVAERTRYRLLFTVRAFLLDEVATRGEQPAADQRFVRWSVRTAEDIGHALVGPDEAEADLRLRAELDNLRAARDIARDAGLVDARVRITLALDRPVIWRDAREVWAWCLELTGAPESAGHPWIVEILGAGAEAARQAGRYGRAVELAEQGLEIERSRHGDATGAASRCWSALAGVAHYRGDFVNAAASWAEAARVPGPTGAALLGSAALAAGYSGDFERARDLLAEAHACHATAPSASNFAFLTYVSAEQLAVDDPAGAIAVYGTAIEAAVGVGADFVAGVAGVALASAQARVGDTAAAAAAYSRLLDYWRVTGREPQLWTTARNAAALLASEGHAWEAALLLLHADARSGAAAVDGDIARYSGRRFVPLEAVVAGDEADAVRAAAATVSHVEAIEAARRALESVASLVLDQDPSANRA